MKYHFTNVNQPESRREWVCERYCSTGPDGRQYCGTQCGWRERFSPSDSLLGIRTHGTPSGYVEVYRFDKKDNFQSILGHYVTPLADNEPMKFTSVGYDLIGIKQSNTGTNSTEVHILSYASGYRNFTLQTGTPLHETDSSFDFFTIGRDIYCIKKSNTGTNSSEIHVLDGDRNYSAYRLQIGTKLHEVPHEANFFNLSADVVAVLRTGTGTSKTEIHVLDSTTRYQSFRLQVPTPFDLSNESLIFTDVGEDVLAIATEGTESGHPEVSILKPADNYASVEARTVLNI